MKKDNKGSNNHFFGKHHTKESKEKISVKAKERYKNPEDNPMYGKHHTKETKKKMSDAKKGKYIGKDNHMFGKHPTEETRLKMSKARRGKKSPLRGRKISIEVKEKISQSLTGKHPSDIARKKMSKAKKGNQYSKGVIKNKETLEKLSKSLKKTFSTKENKEKRSKTSKTLWADDEFREKTIKAQLKGLLKRPTSLEREMIELIDKYDLPYKYTGDGSFLIGFKNPDFVDINGKKICIEVGNIFHHQGNYAEERIKHFKKYGWECIVFIMDNINEEIIMNELQIRNAI